MDKDVSAGSTTTIVGRLALAVTLLAAGLGYTGVLNDVTASDTASLARYVGGVALFVAGLMAFRDRDTAGGTAFAALGALWFTWAGLSGAQAASGNAAGLFLLLFALVALSLTFAGGDMLGQGMYGLLFVSLVLLAVAAFADNGTIAKIGGWFAVVAGAVAWYAATAAFAHWPMTMPRRTAGRRMTVTG